MPTTPYMQLAVEAARKGMESNMGGPFGAVIVRNGEVISTAHNEVIPRSRFVTHVRPEFVLVRFLEKNTPTDKPLTIRYWYTRLVRILSKILSIFPKLLLFEKMGNFISGFPNKLTENWVKLSHFFGDKVEISGRFRYSVGFQVRGCLKIKRLFSRI